MDQNNDNIRNPYLWEGLNLLGYALMEARDFLRDNMNFKYAYDKQLLLPWKKFPGIDPGDMFWRMGGGESYVMEVAAPFEKFSKEEQIAYELSYPAWGDWNGFYSAS